MVCKYKVGDRVIVQESNVDDMFGSHEGMHGTITSVMPTLPYPCLVDINGDVSLWCRVKCLETDEKPIAKVGDKVVIEESSGDIFCNKTRGKTGTVLSYDKGRTYNYRVKLDDSEYILWCKIQGLEKKDKIVITHDGKTTTATHYHSNGGKTEAIAKCCPEDEFNFTVGAKIAMERLESAENPPKQEYYNGMVVCVSSNKYNNSLYTVGKIYQFTNGRLTADNGEIIPKYDPITSFKDLERFSNSKWLEIVQ